MIFRKQEVTTYDTNISNFVKFWPEIFSAQILTKRRENIVLLVIVWFVVVYIYGFCGQSPTTKMVLPSALQPDCSMLLLCDFIIYLFRMVWQVESVAK
jgi:hypothetical protein